MARPPAAVPRRPAATCMTPPSPWPWPRASGCCSGIERERRKGEGSERAPRACARSRWSGWLGGVSWRVGGAVTAAVALGFVGAGRGDRLCSTAATTIPGLTTEVALVVDFLLGALAQREADAAAAARRGHGARARRARADPRRRARHALRARAARRAAVRRLRADRAAAGAGPKHRSSRVAQPRDDLAARGDRDGRASPGLHRAAGDRPPLRFVASSACSAASCRARRRSGHGRAGRPGAGYAAARRPRRCLLGGHVILLAWWSARPASRCSDASRCR